MRFTLPNRAFRAQVTSLLVSFFDEGDEDELREAMRMVAQYYGVKAPRILWRRIIDKGHTAARTSADNTIELMRPRHWHLQHVVKPTAETWAEVTLHEIWHALTWVDEERKADAFARRWMES